MLATSKRVSQLEADLAYSEDRRWELRALVLELHDSFQRLLDHLNLKEEVLPEEVKLVSTKPSRRKEAR